MNKICECGVLRNITEGGHFPACTRCGRRLKAQIKSPLEENFEKAMQLLRDVHRGELFGPDGWDTVEDFLRLHGYSSE